jgi:endoglucanase
MTTQASPTRAHSRRTAVGFLRPAVQSIARSAATTALLCVGLVSCGGAGGTTAPDAGALAAYPPAAAGNPPGASARAVTAAAALGRGVNFGNMLEPPKEGDWGLTVEQRFIDLLDGGTFRSVRLPVRWSNHASADASAVIDPAFFSRVDSVVDRLLGKGVYVVLDMHHYRQLDGDALDANEQSVDPAVVEVRLLAMWRQIAARYKNRSDRLILEVYNEPHGNLNDRWNDIMARAVGTIRREDAQRLIVVGPTSWNSASDLSQLVLPNDANLLLTVHNYEPFNFTHQGATWVSPTPPIGTDCCSADQLAQMSHGLDLAKAYGLKVGYPVFVGEFGSFSAADNAARLRYSRAMRDLIEARGMSWTYWELAAGFGIYDPTGAGAFRADLKDALYGK